MYYLVRKTLADDLDHVTQVVMVFIPASRQTVSEFKRTYFLLFVGLLVVPILNVQSLFELARKAMTQDELETTCILLPDNGAYFINALLFMALFTCSLDLLRWKSLVHFVWIAVSAKSWSEIRVRIMNAAHDSPFFLASLTEASWNLALRSQ